MASPTPPPCPRGFHGEFYTDLYARSAYSEGAGPYRIVPMAVAVPSDLDDLLILIEAAVHNDMPLIPRGAGSGMSGGNVGRGIVVDLQRFNRPRKIFPVRGANVGAAVTWGAVTDAASWNGLRLPPDPASGAFCTIGGMVATNAAGARSVRYGSIRGWVRGLELVTVDGEVGWLGRTRAHREPRWPTRGQPQRFIGRLTAESRFSARAKPAIEERAHLIQSRFPTTRKNSSGYALDHFLESGDLIDLIIGSEGTLGFVTRIELALDAVPGAISSLLLSIADLESLPDIVQSLLALEPTAVELLDRSFFAHAGTLEGLSLEEMEAVLLVEFERDSERAARAVVADAISATKGSCGHLKTAFTEPERKELWAFRSAAAPSLANLPRNQRSLQIVGDGCVPVESLATYLRGVREAARDAGIETVVFGHAGDGHLHVNALVDTNVADFRERLARLLEGVTDLVVQLGGTPSGEHGDGRLRAPVLGRIYGPDILELFRLVKAAFDPTGLLNPGVILPGSGAASVADLKVGETAAPIPEEMAAGLYEIERHGRWGTPKLEIASRATPPLAQSP